MLMFSQKDGSNCKMYFDYRFYTHKSISMYLVQEPYVSLNILFMKFVHGQSLCDNSINILSGYLDAPPPFHLIKNWILALVKKKRGQEARFQWYKVTLLVQ